MDIDQKYFRALSAGDIKEATRLLDNGADGEITDYYGNSALNLATKKGDFSCVKKLVEKYAFLPDYTNDNELSSFMTALVKCYPIIFDYLIDNGADVNMSMPNGDSPLVYASKIGRSDFISSILNAGTDPNYQNKNGYTALMYAVFYGDNKITDLIEVSEAGVRNKSGQTFLDIAALQGKQYTLNTLKERGIVMTSRNIEERDCVRIICYFAMGSDEQLYDYIWNYSESEAIEFIKSHSEVALKGEDLFDYLNDFVGGITAYFSFPRLGVNVYTLTSMDFNFLGNVPKGDEEELMDIFREYRYYYSELPCNRFEENFRNALKDIALGGDAHFVILDSDGNYRLERM